MQLFNKSAIKKTFVHTWYIYPLLVGLVTVIWLWAFNAYHQPTKHQQLSLFFSARIKSDSFVNSITKNYDPENLREVTVSGLLPGSSGYKDKFDASVAQGDILILDDGTIEKYKEVLNVLFYSITDEVKTDYFPGTHEYYTYDDGEAVYTYGILLKRLNEEHYLSKYMVFNELCDYYVMFTRASVNVGILKSESNRKYDNALTFANYLLEL